VVVEDCDQDQEQELSQPGEDEAEVVAYGGEDGVCGVTVSAFEVAAAEVSVGLHVTDDGFDGGAAKLAPSERRAKMRSEDQGMLGGAAGSKKCATTTAAMTARTANPIAS
jgi:hypothetical protein